MTRVKIYDIVNVDETYDYDILQQSEAMRGGPGRAPIMCGGSL